AWGVERFEIRSTRDGVIKVVLGSVPGWLWRRLIRFAQSHDCSGNPPERLSFDAASGSLKPYTPEIGPTLDSGYHAFISADEIDHDASSVDLIWDLIGVEDGTPFSSRGLWTCGMTFNWLRDELMRAALPGRQRRWWQFHAPREGIDMSDLLTDRRSPDLRALLHITDLDEFKILIDEIQNLLNRASLNNPVLFPATDYRRVLSVIADATENLRPAHVGYAASRTEVEVDDPTNPDTLTEAIEGKPGQLDDDPVTCRAIDLALCALSDVILQATVAPPATIAERLRTALTPLLPRFEEIQFVLRHMPGKH
ncbi:hypothetical protein, partial [Arenibaculum sp.]|uniref:hypothetical protein n=1 Tax=Arenibaculum sp. TaxID=2865862 RepID=UPI002E155D6A|nr:hypothetical protein [Arenibaculum sp.]